MFLRFISYAIVVFSIITLIFACNPAFGQAGGAGGGRTETPQVPLAGANPTPTSEPSAGMETGHYPDPLISPDPAAPLLAPYYDLKHATLNDLDLHVQLGYTFLYQYATNVLSPADVRNDGRDLLNGRLDFGVEWRFLHYGSSDTAGITALLRSGTNIGRSQDFILNSNVGAAQGIDSLQGGSKQVADSLNLIYYEQTFFDRKLAVFVGKLHPNQHIDLSMVADDESNQFLAGCFDGNASNPEEGAYSPGIAVEAELPKDLHIHVLAISTEGLAQTGLESLNDGRYYEAAELGWQPAFGKDQRANDGTGYRGVYRAFFWHNNTATGDGVGVGFGADQEIGNGWTPFFRWGIGDSDATNIRQTYGGGIANVDPFGRHGDMFGVGVSWADPSGQLTYGTTSPGTSPSTGTANTTPFPARQETLLETFYRINLTDSVQISPDIEWLIRPAYPRANSGTVIAGLRVKVVF